MEEFALDAELMIFSLTYTLEILNKKQIRNNVLVKFVYLVIFSIVIFNIVLLQCTLLCNSRKRIFKN